MRPATHLLKTVTKKMPAFTLYGAVGSTNTDRIRLTLAEASFTDFETVLLSLPKGEQKSPEHLARHPWGKVPVLVFPSGLVLYESRAASKYLARQYGPQLLPPPTDLEATALFDQAESVEMLNFTAHAARIIFEKFGKRFAGLPTDEAAVAAALPPLEYTFNALEKILGTQSYVAGNKFSLVDLSYVPLINRLRQCGYASLVDERPAVKAWWERVVGRPAVQKVLAPPA